MRPTEKSQSPESQLRALISRSSPTDQKLIRAVRTVLRKRLPTADEHVYDYRSFMAISYTGTAHGKDGVLTLTTRGPGVRLYFGGGPRLPDPKKLLKGSAGSVRYIVMGNAKELSDPEVKALIAAAIAGSKHPLPKSGRGKVIVRTFGAARRPAKKSAK